MPRAVHISACVVLMVVTMSAAAQEDITIHITGPVRIIGGGFGTTGEGHVPTAEQCTEETGFCVETGDNCNGTIKMLHNSCDDHCTCCVIDNIGCLESYGFFRLPGTQPCLKVFLDHERNWADAKLKCESEGLELLKPYEPVKLQKYLNKRFGNQRYWLDAKGTGTSFKWLRDGQELSFSSPLWLPDFPGKRISNRHCLILTTFDTYLMENPGKPYYAGTCSTSNTRYTLCTTYHHTK